MKGIAILLMLVVVLSGCVTTTTVPTTTTIETMITTTTPTTIAEITEQTTVTTTIPTTTTIEHLEKGIDITSARDGNIRVKNMGRVREIFSKSLTLYINDQVVDGKWHITLFYAKQTVRSYANCNVGDIIRVVGPVNEDAEICAE